MNLNELNTFFVNHSYEVAENENFIQQPLTALDLDFYVIMRINH